MHGFLRTLSQSVVERIWGNQVRGKAGDYVSLVIVAQLWPESGICHQLMCDLSSPAFSGSQPDDDVGRLSCIIYTEYSILIVLGDRGLGTAGGRDCHFDQNHAAPKCWEV